MKVFRGVKTSVEEGVEEMVVDRYRYQGGVDKHIIIYQIRISIDPAAVEKLLRRQKHSRSIHQVSRSYWDCDRKKLKKLDRQQGIEEVSRRYQASF